MSGDSDGPKNDPLFERLFAEAEACLDKGRSDTAPSGTPDVVPHSPGEITEVESSALRNLPQQTHRKPTPEPARTRRDARRPMSSGSTASMVANLEKARRETADNALALSEAKVAKLKARLNTAKERAKRDQDLALSKQKDKMLRDFLTLLDDLERALSIVLDEEDKSPQFESYRKGIRQVYEGGLQLLSHFSVKRFESVGEVFDPGLHEAVRRESRNDMDANRVVEVFQAGYMIEDRLLRAARVSVSAPSA